ncbi:protein-export chaperone SecB [Amylibacter sp. SFDW26]|uniref:protein-export chaperone SecB n=1 Tax=Amylibacter sp. SFDW26 TaxID=2652722 RepID=UPI001261DFAF|nr:protein-export chaperone SecB [Amylibacter sp. SFDW26]KAB7614572.1 protein-export chaperone SecB [Amylibacter sp. SFDW26]
MAEEEKAAAASEEQQAPRMQIVNQYIRDLSFENVAAQKSSNLSAQPDISVQVNLDARKGNETQYEVIQKLTISAVNGEDTIFLLEIDYAGIFRIENVPEDQLHPFLMIECPRMLFPFVRRIVRDVTADGGFPPLNVDNIDFVQLYRAELARMAAEQTEPAN